MRWTRYFYRALQSSGGPMADQPSSFSEALDKHQSGDLNGADLLYEQCIRESPEFPDAYNMRAILLCQRGNLDAAIEVLRQGFHYRPDHFDLCHNLASLL